MLQYGKNLGKKSFVSDSNTVYTDQRRKVLDYLKAFYENGFNLLVLLDTS